MLFEPRARPRAPGQDPGPGPGPWTRGQDLGQGLGSGPGPSPGRKTDPGMVPLGPQKSEMGARGPCNLVIRNHIANGFGHAL